MTRANKRDTLIRHALETIGSELAVIDTSGELADLRIKQAQERSGLVSLLGPAQQEMNEIRNSAALMHRAVVAALAMLQE